MTQRIAAIVVALIVSCGAVSAGEKQTPAEVGIRKAQEKIAAQPDAAEPYNVLAMAYARRARETSDTAFYQKALETLERSFAIEPNNFEGRKAEAWLMLGRHEFASALPAAEELNRRMPDDLMTYGMLADANAELGNYPEAVKAAQWMLNLRPGSIGGLTRAAYLRELHGDLSGALELMQMAYDSTSGAEVEELAWLLTQMSHLHHLAGELSLAESAAKQALAAFPGYHYALGALARVRISQKRFPEAVDLLKQRYSAAPHAENLYALAEALRLAGQDGEAAEAYSNFEQKALAESRIADNSNHELIAYYAGYGSQPVKAVELAEQELQRRHDIYTVAAYAKALAAFGDFAGARREMEKALVTGVKDPAILEQAQAILQGASLRAER